MTFLGNVATLRTTDISDDGKINYSTMPRARIDEDKFRTHFLKPRDFLVTRSGTCGIATVFENFDIPVLAGAFLIRMVLSNQLDPYFLRDYLNSSIGQIRVAAIASGAVQKNISGTSLKNFYIPVPSKAEQFKIAGLIGRVSKKIMTETLRRDALDSLFQSMLHHLMVGKTRVLSSRNQVIPEAI